MLQLTVQNVEPPLGTHILRNHKQIHNFTPVLAKAQEVVILTALTELLIPVTL